MPDSQELQSLISFARNITDQESVAHRLLDVARAELGQEATESDLARRAQDLLLQSLCAVGIDPQTERKQRTRLFSLLRGDPLAHTDVQDGVEYILSQMVIQPKGALAECLAIEPCMRTLRSLQASGRFPPDTILLRSAWSRRLSDSTEEGAPILPEWGECREAADGLFVCRATAETRVSGMAHAIQDGDLLVLGVVEVKCFRRISRRKLSEQMNKHLVRLAGGLQLRDASGRQIEQEYPPEKLWYATWENGTFTAVPATMSPEITTVISSLIRCAVGPRLPEGASEKRGGKHLPPFDAELPYDHLALEELGAAMAFYTLGVLADQPEVDLPGAEWGWNVERALEAAPGSALSKWQRARRDKILRRIRGD